ncbi:hypothetical protein AG1IA_08178 [Rhizoctonia solani AG-1 IA]|uniref:Uncharacterized protein n=1 Tax=Thanatephorus cucumeris (strain AG1-IA) TaxID=983506 RepID=L8WM22_THACA|nr:hypothetical protein AG1IA_08178 [Rhizoctonia solani AG-1 IA]
MCRLTTHSGVTANRYFTFDFIQFQLANTNITKSCPYNTRLRLTGLTPGSYIAKLHKQRARQSWGSSPTFSP